MVMRKRNHYEAAFEQFLRSKALPCIAVDQVKRSMFASVDLKSFDFIVYLPHRRNLIVDVKGRKARVGKQAWLGDCWVSRVDIEAMSRWQHVFGGEFTAALVFAFWLTDLAQVPLFDVFEFHGRYYQFFAVYLDDYRRHARNRSAKWDTVTIPRSVFSAVAVEFDRLIDGLSDEAGG